jgi:hypothetical protein
VASQRQLEEMAARYGMGRARDLLEAAQKLADEFGETVALDAVLAALKRRVATRAWADADSRVPTEPYRESRPVYADLDEIGLMAEEGEHARSAAEVGVHDQAAPGRVSLRSLLGGRRSSEGLVDEDQAVANCKPLSTAVLSISRERPRTPGTDPRLMPTSAYPRGQREDRRALGRDSAMGPHATHPSSPLAARSTASSRGSGGEDVA